MDQLSTEHVIVERASGFHVRATVPLAENGPQANRVRRLELDPVEQLSHGLHSALGCLLALKREHLGEIERRTLGQTRA